MGRTFSNFTKEDTFFISYNNQMLSGVISRCGTRSCTLQKKIFLSPSVWPKREYTWTLIWKKSLLICFDSCQGGVPCSNRQSRKRMMNTFIMVNITPVCRDNLEDKSMLVPSKKELPSPFSLIRKRIYLGTHLKEELTDFFWKLPGYSLFGQAEKNEDGEHFANG